MDSHAQCGQDLARDAAAMSGPGSFPRPSELRFRDRASSAAQNGRPPGYPEIARPQHASAKPAAGGHAPASCKGVLCLHGDAAEAPLLQDVETEDIASRVV